MLKPLFNKYSLALIKNGRIIFSSSGKGIRPLVECIVKIRGKENDCILHDKIIGLAAARLILYSGMVSEVLCETASIPAVSLLEQNYIKVNVKTIVKNILTVDRRSICPMELKAEKLPDNKLFFIYLNALMKEKY